MKACSELNDNSYSTAGETFLRIETVFAAGSISALLAKFGVSGSVEVFVDEAIQDFEIVGYLCSDLEPDVVRIVSGRPSYEKAIQIAEGTEDHPIVVAIGGGSTMDFAKAVCSFRIFPPSKHSDQSRVFSELSGDNDGAFPFFVAIPSTAGSGADQSRYFVVYEEQTGRKRFGRSWSLTADVTLVEPKLLTSLPSGQLFLSAFDAFIHHLEAIFNLDERGPASDFLAASAIRQIVRTVESFQNGTASETDQERLIVAASLGGVVLSSVRSGIIHEFAGPLTEILGLSHAAALLLVAECFVSDLEEAYPKEITDVLGTIFHGATPLASCMRWWSEICDDQLTLEVNRARERFGSEGEVFWESLLARLEATIMQDQVLVEKVSAMNLDAEFVRKKYQMIKELMAG